MDTSNNSNFTTHIEDEKESFITDDKTKSRKCTVKKEYRAPISIGFSLVMIVVLATSCSASPPDHSGSCSVEAVRGSVVTKVSSKNSHDIINAQVNGAYVASCTLHPPSAEISEAEYKELYAIATTPNKECVFTIYSFNGTSIAINITSATSSLAEGIIEGLASSCIYPSALVFKLIERKEVPVKRGLSAGAIAGIVITVLVVVVVITNIVQYRICWKKDRWMN